jgi:hypothetical protein
MCEGIRDNFLGASIQVLFGPLRSKIPVLYRSAEVHLYEWGCEGRNTIRQPSMGPLKEWPQGCCVPLESIKAGEWDYFRPRSCKVPATAFAVKDHAGVTRWFDVDAKAYLQGVYASPWYEPKVYLVSVPAPKDVAHIAVRWPRIVGGAKSWRTFQRKI